jgi:hypothetical protein
VTDVTHSLKDAAYVAVGFGVIGFQKAQVRRQELNRQWRQQREQFSTQLGTLVKGLDGAVQPVREQIEGRLDRFEEHLPGQAKDLVHTARALAKSSEDQMRGLIGAGA